VPPDDNEYRLPRTVVPSRYDLELEPDLEAARFTGSVRAALAVHEPVDAVVVNAIDLELDEAWVEAGDGTRLDATVTYDERTERAHLALSGTLAAGPATFHARFRGTLNDKLRGFYRSTFTDADGAEQVIACTQFQSTDARRCFPCWDEPDLKAVFGVTLVVDDSLTAVANTAVVSEEPTGDGRRRVRFADTISMSSYLVAFVVGRLEATDPVDVDGTPLRVVHVPGKGHLTATALDVAAFALRLFSRYYGIGYPGDKVDLVALPDFAAGAMENIGCITFREALLLLDPATATQQEEQLVADVVSHELAHMWFGDLVTMRWWNGIWLNEAFATFMEIMSVDEYRPDWKRWVIAGLDRSAAFDTDALESTRPVEYEVVSPRDAEGMFDVLTYDKGGALLRMLEQYVGPREFRDGIRAYLQAHAYANTETHDLWDALEESSKVPVRRIMDAWIFQGGYPVLDVGLDAGRGVVRVQQHRFRYDGAADATTWPVPLLVRQEHLGAAQVDRVLVEADGGELPLLDPAAVVVANAGGFGFVRVRYAPELLGRLTGPVLGRLSSIERYNLVDDAWATVVSGELDAARFTELARAFADETDLAVWQAVVGGLSWCDRFVEGATRERFRAYVRALVAPALHRLGWQAQPGEEDLVAEVRGLLVRTLAVLGDDPDAQARARELYTAAMAGAAVDPAVVSAALLVVASTATPEDWDAIVHRFRTADTPQDQIRHLYALADVPTAELLARTLELALSGEVRTQNAPYLLGRALRHREHGALAWRFVQDHWAEMFERFPVPSTIRMLEGVKSLVDPSVAATVPAFFADHDVPQAARTLRQVLERQRINVELRERARASLASAFA
jgi:puromycin-sensitive aminopeptidase